MNYIYMDSLVGTLTICETDGYITHILFGRHEQDKEPFESDALREAKRQLTEYFDGKRRDFDLRLRPKGTEFQMHVWQALKTVPYGQTASYKDIAQKVMSPKGFRAVGMANNKNPISIVVP